MKKGTSNIEINHKKLDRMIETDNSEEPNIMY